MRTRTHRHLRTQAFYLYNAHFTRSCTVCGCYCSQHFSLSKTCSASDVWGKWLARAGCGVSDPEFILHNWHHEDGHRHTAAQFLVHGSAQMVPRGSSQSHPEITSPSLGITRCCTFCSKCSHCCFQCFSLSRICSVGDRSGDDKLKR